MTPESLQKHTGMLLERIEKKPVKAQELINSYIASHKHFNAEDKRALLNCVWKCVRLMARLKYAYPNENWEARVHAFFEKGSPDSETMPNAVKWEVQDWFLAHVPEAEKELPALLDAPPIVLRAIGDRNEVQQLLHDEGIETTPTKLSPYGLILPEYKNLSATHTWKEGLIEIQDEGAQLVALPVPAENH